MNAKQTEAARKIIEAIERLRVAENKIARIEAQCLRAIEDGGNDYQYAIEEIASILGIPVFATTIRIENGSTQRDRAIFDQA